MMSTIQYTTFKVGANYFAINILLIREINRNLNITPVCLSPDFIKGLLNLRGQIVTVMDLGTRIENESIQISKTSRCIILKHFDECKSHMNYSEEYELEGEEQIGLLVERIGDMISIDDNDLDEPPPSLGGIPRDYISKVYRTPEKLYLILDAYNLLTVNNEVK